MLRLEGYETFTLLAIDPGLNNTGVAVFTVQIDPPALLRIEAETLKADRLINTSGLDDEDYIERVHKRYAMRSALLKFLRHYRPDVTACESPFFDRRKPGSFAVLSEVLTTLFDTVTGHHPSVRFTLIEPLTAKAVLGVAGQKGKEVVKVAISELPSILEALEGSLDDLDEHAIDAVGIGVTYLVRKMGLFPELDRRKSK